MTILAVDDEKLALSALVDELKTVFPNDDIHSEQLPEKALEYAYHLKSSGNDITYAFLDIRMRGTDGLQLAKKLKTIYPNLILFFCTAYTQYALDAFGLYAKGYLMKPIRAKEIERVLDEMVTDWRKTSSTLARDIRVQTFGNFEIFLDGKPLVFERAKAKELLAYLVDRHGVSITTKQIALTLWEDSVYDRKLKNIVTATVASLKKTLSSVGIEDIFIKSWNQCAIDVNKIKCDAYDFEKGDIVAINSFHGEYMSNYSWAEFSVGNFFFNN